MSSVAIIGPGRAGTHLAAALRAVGWSVALCGRDDPVPPADLTILAVRDREIDALAATPALRDRLLAHLSGLRPASPSVRLALHPAMTFPAPATGPVSLAGVGFGMTAYDDEAARRGCQMVAALGGVVVEVPAACRPLYHAACALASNVLVILEEAAADAARRAGVAEPRAFLGPLVAATVANWRDQGPAALSGPIVRADWETVDVHLDTLTGVGRDLYRAATSAVARS